MNQSTFTTFLESNPGKYLILYMDNQAEISVEGIKENADENVLHVTEPSEYVVNISKISHFELLQRSTY